MRLGFQLVGRFFVIGAETVHRVEEKRANLNDDQARAFHCARTFRYVGRRAAPISSLSRKKLRGLRGSVRSEAEGEGGRRGRRSQNDGEEEEESIGAQESNECDLEALAELINPRAVRRK